MNNPIYVVHIQQRVGGILDFTIGEREDFLDSPIIQDAVLRNLEVIGEAVKQRSPEVRQVSRVPHVVPQRLRAPREVQ